MALRNGAESGRPPCQRREGRQGYRHSERQDASGQYAHGSSSNSAMSPQTTQTPKSPKRKFDWLRPFGRTGLRTSCLAIGGGMMISSEDLLYAFDKGIRTFFFSSDLHHFAYRNMVPALRELCGKSSSRR